MPYKYSNELIAVELHELVPRFWKSLPSLQQELHRYENKPFGIKRLQKGGNGRKLLINFDTLSEAIQQALGDPRKVNHPLEPFFEFDPEAVRFYGEFKREVGGYLSKEEQERYIINASVMKAVLKLEQARIEERVKRGGSTRGILDTIAADVESFQNSLRVKYQMEHTLPASRRFKETFNNFKMLSYYSIIKDPKGLSTQNARKVDRHVEMLFNALFANQYNKPTPTEVARCYEAFLSGNAEVYNEDTGELFDPKGFKKLSQSTIISYINKWENRIATHMTRSSNRQVYMGQYKPHHQMEFPTMAGSLLSIDDRQPPFWYDKGKRMWFYVGMDVASRCITAVVHGDSKEGIILNFYRQIVRNYTEWGFGLPLELECESSLNSSFRNTLLRPGAMFENVRIEANNARGKYIERAFGSIRYEIEKQSMGWIGRPHAKSEANQARPGAKAIIPYDQLVNDRLRDLETWNNMPHPDMPSISRWDYFTQYQNPDLKPTNWHAILPVIGFRTSTSCKAGYVTLQGQKRAIAEHGKILTGEILIQKMRVIEGKELDVFWLDGNDGSVLKALVYLNDRLICEVMEMPRYNRATAERGEKDEAAQRLQSAYVMTVEAFARTQRNSIESIQIIDRTPKTINSNFKFSTVTRFEPSDKPIEVFPDSDNDRELVPAYVPESNAPLWRQKYQ